ncbi:MAG: response regulator transcription factor [Nitrosomonas sp.]|nr:response regulator transcription factor [Nitrosomonas sp.]
MHILLVDDHTLFREALIHILNQLDEHVIVLEAADVSEAKQLISYTRTLDLILLDIGLPEVDGLTALPDLRTLTPTIPIVVLSASESSLVVKHALDNGSSGYIPKSCSSHEMLAALRIVLQGDVFVPIKLRRKITEGSFFTEESNDTRNSDLVSLLTARQIEVLQLIAKGLPNKSIANQLNIADGTVKLHVAAILQALGTLNRTQAVAEALRRGIISTNN